MAVLELTLTATWQEVVPAAMLARWRVCPLRVERQGSRSILYVATDQPENLPALDELAFVTSFTVRPVLALPEDIERTLRHHGLSGTRGTIPLELEPDDGSGLEISRGGEGWPGTDAPTG